jgi:hypothetical protein
MLLVIALHALTAMLIAPALNQTQRGLLQRKGGLTPSLTAPKASTDGYTPAAVAGIWHPPTDACRRHGVTCDISRQFVKKLDLSGCGLTGTIPAGSIFTSIKGFSRSTSPQ